MGNISFNPKIVCVSGYFDPLHVGHLEYFEKAKQYGNSLTVIVNNDAQAELKKNKAFMKDIERVEIIRNLKMVDNVVLSIDEDRTVCKTLSSIKPTYFCNGGDQFNDNIPEREICEENEIILIDGLGEKIQSSSALIKENESVKESESLKEKRCIFSFLSRF